jgi:phage gpG-like protein
MNLYNFYGRVIELWNGWELRAMILLSLSLQIFLTITGSRRKYTAGIWFGMFVWLAYLSADWFATITLGILARSQGGSESKGTTSNASFIPAFWAPMLLVHLGGPDTITAYSVEDNELWSRHLLQLLTQLAVAFYVSLRSWWSNDPLIYMVIPIFVSGVIKYGEKIWVLWCASSSKLMDSANEAGIHVRRQIYPEILLHQKLDDILPQLYEILITELGIDRLKQMLGIEGGTQRGLSDIFVTEQGMRRIVEMLGTEGFVDQIDDILSSEENVRRINEILGTEGFDKISGFNNIISEAKKFHEACFLFQTLKVLFADYTVPFPVHRISYGILQSKDAAGAFKLIEVELGFMFDVLFTKVMTTVCPRPRIILRFITFLSSVSALVAFSSMTRNSHTYSKIDIIVSYLLLFGATVLEIYSAILMIFSDWGMLWLSDQRKPLADSISRVICSSRLLSFFSNNKKWKASIAQYEPKNSRESPCKHLPKIFRTGNIQSWEDVGCDLKELIFKRVLDMRSRCNFPLVPYKILEERGDHALRSKDCLEKFEWSVVLKDFHESFLIWHIAVNTCVGQDSIHCNMSRSLSRYMMYLWSDLPFMLPKELGEPKYKQIGQNSEGSALSDGDELAKSLNLLQSEQKWEMISEVLVEMLTYSAIQCGWKEHARALQGGGELLTLVAVLMAHLGLHGQCA